MQKFIPVVKGVRDRPKVVVVVRAGGPVALAALAGVDVDGGDEDDVGDGVPSLLVLLEPSYLGAGQERQEGARLPLERHGAEHRGLEAPNPGGSKRFTISDNMNGTLPMITAQPAQSSCRDRRGQGRWEMLKH